MNETEKQKQKNKKNAPTVFSLTENPKYIFINFEVQTEKKKKKEANNFPPRPNAPPFPLLFFSIRKNINIGTSLLVTGTFERKETG